MSIKFQKDEDTRPANASQHRSVPSNMTLLQCSCHFENQGYGTIWTSLTLKNTHRNWQTYLKMFHHKKGIKRGHVCFRFSIGSWHCKHFKIGLCWALGNLPWRTNLRSHAHSFSPNSVVRRDTSPLRPLYVGPFGNRAAGVDDLLGKKNDQRVQTLLYPGSYGTYETYGTFSETKQWLKLQVCKKLPLKWWFPFHLQIDSPVGCPCLINDRWESWPPVTPRISGMSWLNNTTPVGTLSHNSPIIQWQAYSDERDVFVVNWFLVYVEVYGWNWIETLDRYR
jgi:hypothetical protein